jgi:hypothetical protein
VSEAMHPLAPHHLPGFIVAPGETDVLLTGSIIFLIALLMMLGSLYFWLHSLPERIAHGASQVQFQLVAVLALLALFTHNNVFWVAALLLAIVPIPDFWTPLSTMAESLARMAAGRGGRPAAADVPAASAPEAIAAGSSLSVNDAPLSQVRVVELADGKPFEAPSAPPDDQHRVPTNEERRS